MTETRTVRYELQDRTASRDWMTIGTFEDFESADAAFIRTLWNGEPGEYNDRLRVIEVVTTVTYGRVLNARRAGA